MRVVLFGATGMIGSGVLLECLTDPRVAAVLSISRSPSGHSDAKLTEVLHDDFYDYGGIADQLRDVDACFFCLGVSAVGMAEADYRRITVDLTVCAAEALDAASPDLRFFYVSGAGTDSTERGRQMWARVKGHVENRLLAMPLSAWMFRPGVIFPVKGVRSKTRWYRLAYGLARPLFPLLRRLLPRHVMRSDELGRAMIHVALHGYPTHVLEASDIITVARAASPPPDDS